MNSKNWNAKKTSAGHSKNTKQHNTYNLIIVDESGSMSSIYDQTLSGINETLGTIKQAATDFPDLKQFVTLVTFDTGHYNTIFDKSPIEKTRRLTRNDYHPGGCTPLYDAMGRAITEMAADINDDDAVLVTIITDGYENASCEYSGADIKALVEQMKEKGWVFTYIGANQDAKQVGISFSITNTLNFEATPQGTDMMWKKERSSRTAFMHGLKKCYDESESEEDACAKRSSLNKDYFAD